MTLTQLHYVLAIAECGSLNRAAERLFVAQPSLSGSLRELEKELGIVIFNRSGKGVTPTPDGAEFLQYAREIYGQYETVLEKYGKGAVKKKFAVSTQHYSFAVKAFVEMVKSFDTSEYEFAVRETKTCEVLADVSTGKSEVGVLYLSDFNRRPLQKLLSGAELEFFPLIDCRAFVYLWRGHPLAGKKEIRFADLAPYPCLSFDQGDSAAFYLAEEILSTGEYPRIIKVNDRATTLNLMVGLYGYTLCSGIICEELNGDDYVAVPFEAGSEGHEGVMRIGYVLRKNAVPSRMAGLYIGELRRYLGVEK